MRQGRIAALALLVASTAFGADRVVFTGSKIVDPGGEFQITPMGQKEAIVFVSRPGRFAMVLPYEERWEFVFGGPDFVRGHGGLVNVSVQILPDTWKDDATFLEEVKSGLLKNKGANGTINARITEFAGSQLVLSIADAEVVSKDPSFKDVKQYNYFATRLAGGSRLRYHLSLVVQEGKPGIDPNSLVRNATAGFRVVPDAILH